MLGAVSRAIDRFRGSGQAAITVPPLDGAFSPNEHLDNALAIFKTATPDNLTTDGERVLFSSGATLFELKRSGISATAEPLALFDSLITCLDYHTDGGIVVGLASGGLFLRGGLHDGKKVLTLQGRSVSCPTAVRFDGANTLVICLGSHNNDPTQWKRDLLDGNASGSVWHFDLQSERSTCLADKFAWPNGLVATGNGRIVISESWHHQLVELDGGKCIPILAELPGYPGRIVAAGSSGYWLAIFAPRSQLVEFVLREPRFRRTMMKEIDPEFWVAPSLHHIIDYREPLQAGAMRELGQLKPWAPSRSYGLVVRLDQAFRPIKSMHSRADGKRHGITSCVDIDGQLLLTSFGGDVLLSVDSALSEEMRT